MVYFDVEGHLSKDESAELSNCNWCHPRSDRSRSLGNEANGNSKEALTVLLLSAVLQV